MMAVFAACEMEVEVATGRKRSVAPASKIMTHQPALRSPFAGNNEAIKRPLSKAVAAIWIAPVLSGGAGLAGPTESGKGR